MSNKKNVITIVIAALALVLVVIVALVATGVIKPPEREPETVVESKVVVVSQTNAQGELEYMTVVTKYYKPVVSALHRYPTKPTTTGKGTTTVRYVEQSSFVHLTDPNGIPLFNPDGSPVTEVVTYTIAENSLTAPPTVAPKTSAVAVTDASGNQQTDVSGNPVTEVVTYIETTTQAPDRWSTTQEGTTGFFQIETEVKRDDTLAQNIVEQINEDRTAAGLAPLEHVTGLKASARTNSVAMARPDIYGNKLPAPDSYMLKTTYGGSPVYQTVAAANKSKVMSADITKIGIGVVVYEGTYYTTVIFA